jgi:hypothetical protein
LSSVSYSDSGTSSAFVADVPGTPSAFSKDVPAAAVVAPAVVVTAVVVTVVATAAAVAAAIAAIVAFASNANGFLLFGCEWVGVSEAFRLLTRDNSRRLSCRLLCLGWGNVGCDLWQQW